MANLLSNPQVSAAVTATLSGGVAPATAAANINDASVSSSTFTNGTAAGQVNLVYAAAFTLSSGTPLVIDLANFSDPLSGAGSMGHWNTLKITNNSTTAGQDFTVGGGSNPIFAADPTPVQANGGVYFKQAPNPGNVVDPTSAHNLQITVASGTAVAGQIMIFGRTT